MGGPFKEMNLMLHDAANFPQGVNNQNKKFEHTATWHFF
jgi:hypothetical protein